MSQKYFLFINTDNGFLLKIHGQIYNEEYMRYFEDFQSLKKLVNSIKILKRASNVKFEIGQEMIQELQCMVNSGQEFGQRGGNRCFEYGKI